MKKLFGILLMTVLLAACGNNSTKNGNAEGGANEAITVKYAKGFTVRDSAVYKGDGTHQEHNMHDFASTVEFHYS